MTLPLLDHLASVRARIAASPHVFVGVDYDGTLTPLVSDPAQAVLAEETRALLRRLAARPGTTVAIISGRSMADVRALVGVEGLIYAGNHGLEIEGPGLAFLEPTAAKRKFVVGSLAAVLRRGLTHIHGVLVEDKTFSISVHVRNVAADSVAEVQRHVRSAVAVAPGWFTLRTGNQVFEIRPQLAWHKGTAAAWIRRQLGKTDALTCFLGDDQTDEDMFLSFQDGITVKVGATTPSAAHYCLDGPANVGQFLAWLAELESPTSPQTLLGEISEKNS